MKDKEITKEELLKMILELVDAPRHITESDIIRLYNTLKGKK
jgi:hypothetical protein